MQKDLVPIANESFRMSAIGTKRTWTCALPMSAIGVKRTCRFALQMSVYDPKRTSIFVGRETNKDRGADAPLPQH